jgi:hypothetical protein
VCVCVCVYVCAADYDDLSKIVLVELSLLITQVACVACLHSCQAPVQNVQHTLLRGRLNLVVSAILKEEMDEPRQVHHVFCVFECTYEQKKQ